MITKLFFHGISILLTSLTICLGQSLLEFSTKIGVQITDGDGNMVDGADVLVCYSHLFDSKRYKSYSGKTDAAGRFEATDKVTGSVLIRSSKPNYYPLFVENVLILSQVRNQKIDHLDLPLVMRKIKAPIPLYAKSVNLQIPKPDQAIGFDLQAGDWIEPFGRGKICDVSFSYSKTFLGFRFDENRMDEIREFSKKAAAISHRNWTEEGFRNSAGEWKGALSLSFPNSEDGIAITKGDYFTYSKLRMPHLAYEKGYVTILKREENTNTPSTRRSDIGYFLRTRVELEANKEIVSANYAKITSDIGFDPRGKVQFSYVFNPTPNDRNLEFDPSKNLFRNLDDDEQVTLP